ncbi:MAG: nitrogen fixation protein NifQ [Methylomicrobium sp.]|nr:nitrogen fixation protein NifQ [Methylomicrobium sp.]
MHLESFASRVGFYSYPVMNREQFYRDLIEGSDRSSNALWLAQIITSWRFGEGVLPDCLGLEPDQFDELLKRCFPGADIEREATSGKNLDFSRMLEREDLEKLLAEFRSSAVAESECIAAIIVAACLGSDHLWQDLGLWSRKELSALLAHNFPNLAARNTKDMKWKKFLYKQLCEAEGLYLCRAPSCEVCLDYRECFGPEEE